MRIRYQIKEGSEWITVTKGAPTGKGWLHYELKDGDGVTNGLAKPGNWREKPVHVPKKEVLR